MIYIDYVVSDDCINSNSYGMICVKCGCCSRNPNYRDRIIKQIKYYKEMLKEEYDFEAWDKNEDGRKFQEKVIKANILYFKRKIRRCKKILHCLKTPEKYKERLEDMRSGDK